MSEYIDNYDKWGETQEKKCVCCGDYMDIKIGDKALCKSCGNINNIGESNTATNPSHYTQGEIEVWDFIIDQKLGYLEGNIVKYISRARHKGNEKQDMIKARNYIDKIIKGLEG